VFVKGRLRWRRVGDEFEDFNKGEVEASCKVGEGLQLRIIYQVGALLGPQGSFRCRASHIALHHVRIYPPNSLLPHAPMYLIDRQV